MSPASLRAAPIGQVDNPKVTEPSARVPLTFMAELQPDGAIVSWQVPEAESNWLYAIYRSTDCSWESAVVLSAPIFASTESTTRTVSYSIFDSSATIIDTSRAVVTCNYWLLGTDSDGNAQIFDSATLQGVQRIFLPVILT